MTSRYNCKKCGKEFNKKLHYMNHLHALPCINKSLNVLDLFCGCGGMSKGLTDAGLNVVAGIDIWDVAVNSYNKNYEHKAICADLTRTHPNHLQ